MIPTTEGGEGREVKERRAREERGTLFDGKGLELEHGECVLRLLVVINFLQIQ
jgi:hypothetical protein